MKNGYKYSLSNEKEKKVIAIKCPDPILLNVARAPVVHGVRR